MALKVSETALGGVWVFELEVYGDERGFILETYSQKRYGEAGLGRKFVQDNHSRSCRGTVRGLHYQLRHPQGKLVYVVRGEIFDVAVDIRRGSPSFGQWVGVQLSDQNHKQLFIPEGFAHGFAVVSESADVVYKCTELYTPGDDYGILWSDRELGIDWPVEKPILSAKDARSPALAEASPEVLPRYESVIP